MEIEYFNKLIDNKKNHFKSIDEIENNFTLIFNNLDNGNIFKRKIQVIWKKYKINNIINLKSDDISFIEVDFKGNYDDYLLFIIPRITKLNKKHLNKLIEDDIEDSESENSSIVDKDDKDYINILEININSLQEKLQQLNDKIIPKVTFLEEQNTELINKLEFHEKFTKNSIQILEDRISKMMEIFSKIKL